MDENCTTMDYKNGTKVYWENGTKVDEKMKKNDEKYTKLVDWKKTHKKWMIINAPKSGWKNGTKVEDAW